MASVILMMNYKKCIRWQQNFDRLRKDLFIKHTSSFIGGRQYNDLISKRKILYIISK